MQLWCRRQSARVCVAADLTLVCWRQPAKFAHHPLCFWKILTFDDVCFSWHPCCSEGEQTARSKSTSGGGCIETGGPFFTVEFFHGHGQRLVCPYFWSWHESTTRLLSFKISNDHQRSFLHLDAFRLSRWLLLCKLKKARFSDKTYAEIQRTCSREDTLLLHCLLVCATADCRYRRQ